MIILWNSNIKFSKIKEYILPIIFHIVMKECVIFCKILIKIINIVNSTIKNVELLMECEE